jgi:hypothetical protein
MKKTKKKVSKTKKPQMTRNVLYKGDEVTMRWLNSEAKRRNISVHWLVKDVMKNAVKRLKSYSMVVK